MRCGWLADTNRATGSHSTMLSRQHVLLRGKLVAQQRLVQMQVDPAQQAIATERKMLLTATPFAAKLAVQRVRVNGVKPC